MYHLFFNFFEELILSAVYSTELGFALHFALEFEDLFFKQMNQAHSNLLASLMFGFNYHIIAVFTVCIMLY